MNDCPNELLRQASDFLEAARHAEAALVYDRVLEARPRSLAALLGRGIARSRAGDLQGALDDHHKAVALKPSCAVALEARAATWALAGDNVLAEIDLVASVQLYPRQSALASLGRIRALRFDHEDA